MSTEPAAVLELYHWEPNGPYLKPLILLHEKGLPYRGHYVDVLSLEHRRLGFPAPSQETALSFEGEGPLLVHDGRQISESLFMLEYLEDAFPRNSFRPADARGHASVLAWARHINEYFMPAVNTLGCERYLVPALKGRAAVLEPLLEDMPLLHVQDGWRLALTNGYPTELIEDSRRKITVSTRRMEDALAGSDWLVGSSYSLADIDAFSIANPLPELTPDLVNEQSRPRVMSWLRRIRERPAVKTALATSRTGKPEQAFAPGPEHSRWG